MKYKVVVSAIYSKEFEIEADDKGTAGNIALYKAENIDNICANDVYFTINSIEEIKD